MLRGFPELQRPVHTPQTKVRCGGCGACPAALAQRGRCDLGGGGGTACCPRGQTVTARLSPIYQQPHIAAAGLPAHRGDPKPTPG